MYVFLTVQWSIRQKAKKPMALLHSVGRRIQNLSLYLPKSSFLPARSTKYFNTIHTKKSCELVQAWKQTQNIREEFLLPLKQEVLIHVRWKDVTSCWLLKIHYSFNGSDFRELCWFEISDRQHAGVDISSPTGH